MSAVGPQDAFEAYGRLMASVAAFEQFMRIALAESYARRRPDGFPTAEDQANFACKIMKMDFGKLEQRISNAFRFSADQRRVLKESRDFRNHLAHEFWSPHFGNLLSPRGARIIVDSCRTLEIQFEQVTNLLVAATGMDVKSYVDFVAKSAGKDSDFAGWEDALTKAWQAHAEAGHISPADVPVYGSA